MIFFNDFKIWVHDPSAGKDLNRQPIKHFVRVLENAITFEDAQGGTTKDVTFEYHDAYEVDSQGKYNSAFIAKATSINGIVDYRFFCKTTQSDRLKIRFINNDFFFQKKYFWKWFFGIVATIIAAKILRVI